MDSKAVQAKIINFGSINIDHIYRVPHFVAPGETLASNSLQTVLGGKGANQSVAIARAGVPVAHVGQVSLADEWTIQELADHGVDTSSIQQTEQASGHAIIQVDSHGENAIIIHGGANQSCRLEDLRAAFESHAQAEYLLIQNECNLLSEALQLAAERKLKIAFNPAPMDSNVLNLPVELIDVLFVNSIEAQMLARCESEQDVLTKLMHRFPDTKIVYTRGASGAYYGEAKQIYYAQAETVQAIDTTAAGDTFVGYFMAGLIQQLPAQENLNRASKAAAQAVTKLGAIPSIPRLADL